MKVQVSFSREEVVNALMLGAVLCTESIDVSEIDEWYEKDCVKKTERTKDVHAISMYLIEKEEFKLNEELSLMTRKVIGFVKDSDIFHDREELIIKVYNMKGEIVAEVTYDNISTYTAYKEGTVVAYNKKWRED